MVLRSVNSLLMLSIFTQLTLFTQVDSYMHALQAYHLKIAQEQEGFTSDTLIATSDNLQKISTITTKDRLRSPNGLAMQSIKLIEFRMVVCVYEICTEHYRFQAAASQQFFEERSKQWIKAQDLEVGHVIGSEQVRSSKKLFAINTVYKLTAEQQEFLLDGLVRVHNANVCLAAGLVLNVGRICLRHPVITRYIRHTVSLAKMALQLYQVDDLCLKPQLQQALLDEDILLTTRSYYQNRREELIALLQQYQSIQQAVLAATGQISILHSLHCKSKVSNISALLPDRSVEVSYSGDDRQKLIELREQELRFIEQEIETIQIALALYLQDMYDRFCDADIQLVDIIAKTKSLLQVQTSRHNAEQKCRAALTMLASLQNLEKISQELMVLVKFYQHPGNAILLKQSSNLVEVCSQIQAHLHKVYSVFPKMKQYVVGMQQAVCNSCIQASYISSQGINIIQQQLYAQYQEKEKSQNRSLKIKQSNTTYVPPPNDPDPEDDKRKKYRYKTHPHNDKLNHFPIKERPHGLRDDQGHIPDTVENRQKILDLVRNKDCRVALDKYGNMWYSKIELDGSQLWASVRVENFQIQNCGLNLQPRVVNQETGLCANISKQQRIK